MLKQKSAARQILQFRAAGLAAAGVCLMIAGGLFSSAQAGESGSGLSIGAGIIGLNILNPFASSRNSQGQTTTSRRPATGHARPRTSTRSRATQQATAKQTKSSGKRYAVKTRKGRKDHRETAATTATGAATAVSTDPAASPYLPPSAGNAAPPPSPATYLPPPHAGTMAVPPAPVTANLAVDLTPIRDALEQMGYGSGLETGTMQQAITGFQQDLGAAPTGVLTPDQLQVLYNRHASMKAAITASQPPRR